MSDLEEEHRHRSDRLMSAGQSDDQIESVLNRSMEAWKAAKKVYDAIQIPGELNTRVRAAIESERKHGKQRLVRLMSAGAAVEPESETASVEKTVEYGFRSKKREN